MYPGGDVGPHPLNAYCVERINLTARGLLIGRHPRVPKQLTHTWRPTLPHRQKSGHDYGTLKPHVTPSRCGCPENVRFRDMRLGGEYTARCAHRPPDRLAAGRRDQIRSAAKATPGAGIARRTCSCRNRGRGRSAARAPRRWRRRWRLRHGSATGSGAPSCWGWAPRRCRGRKTRSTSSRGHRHRPSTGPATALRGHQRAARPARGRRLPGRPPAGRSC